MMLEGNRAYVLSIMISAIFISFYEKLFSGVIVYSALFLLKTFSLTW